jgi:hypothetical protein
MVVSGKQKHIAQEAYQAIQHAVELIAEHPSVDRVSDLRPNEDRGHIDVTIDVRLGLPFLWMATGGSPNGVRATEPVNLSFLGSYPINAPIVTLRDDFDRSLAHIQPGPPNGPIVPCLIAGDLNEFLHSHGLMAIVDQIVSWLEKAALGKLIDPSQGWEPIRRDGLTDWIIADGDFLRNFVGRQEQFSFLLFNYLKLLPSIRIDYARKDYILYGAIETKCIAISPNKFPEMVSTQLLHEGAVWGESFAIIATPGKLPSGKPYVADKYLPETVTNLHELQARAEVYGCGTSLKNALSYLARCVKRWKGPDFPIVVILCARRPYRLIGESSNIEIVPYLMECQAPQLFPQGDNTAAYPASHRHAITATLLQRFSGEPPIPEERKLALVGCGSLGSKIAIHLTRSGAAPTIVIDKILCHPITQHVTLFCHGPRMYN